MEEIINGLLILQKYDGFGSIQAEHDQIWAGSQATTKRRLNKEDRESLENLDWFYDNDCESWSHFT